jgi:hypothetical protein
VLSPSGSALYTLQIFLGGHLFIVGKPGVALWIPHFLASGPLWPILFPPEHDEGELMSSLLICVAGQYQLPNILPLVVVAQ